MVRDWRGILTGDLVACHNRYFGDPWRLDEETFRRKTIEASDFDWGVSLVHQHDDGAIEGFVAFKRAPTEWRTAAPDALHLTTLGFDDPEIGFSLMSEAVNRATDRGFDRIVFGRDASHIWPGAPQDVAKLGPFLAVNGFEAHEECFDLERDLSGFRSPFAPPTGTDLRPLSSGEEPRLDAFFAREFPGRWRTDVMRKVSLEGPETVYLLVAAGGIAGFALIQADGATDPIGGGIWRERLGPRWASLGPIGVAASERGKGYGDALLGAALEHLAGLGARRCIIDWTTLDRFYGRCGFEPTRRYRGMTRVLGEDPPI